MGLKDKMKQIRDYFTVEADEVKKEVIQVPIPAPEIKEEKETFVEEKTGPIYFDDKDFADLPVTLPKKEPVNFYKETKVEEKKSFRPSPIISPVYGILDKNYYKEDIVDKPVTKKYETNHAITVDDVRNKAFGTLEDDLETNLMEPQVIDSDDELNLTEGADMFEELVEEPESDELPDITIEHTKIEIADSDTAEKIVDSALSEDDLFDLVNSMYDRKDDNNGLYE